MHPPRRAERELFSASCPIAIFDCHPGAQALQDGLTASSNSIARTSVTSRTTRRSSVPFRKLERQGDRQLDFPFASGITGDDLRRRPDIQILNRTSEIINGAQGLFLMNPAPKERAEPGESEPDILKVKINALCCGRTRSCAGYDDGGTTIRPVAIILPCRTS